MFVRNSSIALKYESLMTVSHEFKIGFNLLFLEVCEAFFAFTNHTGEVFCMKIKRLALILKIFFVLLKKYLLRSKVHHCDSLFRSYLQVAALWYLLRLFLLGPNEG